MFWPSLIFCLLRNHFWPFTEVLGRILRLVTRKKTETLRTTDCTDIPDKGRPRKQKETKVAKVVRNQVRSESSLLPSLSSVRKEAIWRRAPYPFVLSALLSCKFIAACEDCFQAKVDRPLRRRMLKGMCGEAASNLNIEQGTARSTCRRKAG